MACSELGRLDEARAALDELFRLRPNIGEYLSRHRPRIIDLIVEGLGNAGLDIPEEPAADN